MTENMTEVPKAASLLDQALAISNSVREQSNEVAKAVEERVGVIAGPIGSDANDDARDMPDCLACNILRSLQIMQENLSSISEQIKRL